MITPYWMLSEQPQVDNGWNAWCVLEKMPIKPVSEQFCVNPSTPQTKSTHRTRYTPNCQFLIKVLTIEDHKWWNSIPPVALAQARMVIWDLLPDTAGVTCF